MKILLEHGAATHVGKVKQNNEDTFATNGDKRLFIVADGMGGHDNGEQASRIAVDRFENKFDHTSGQREESMRQAIEHAQKIVHIINKQRHGNMGTTLTGLHIDERGNAYIAHAGDSRGYTFNIKGRLQQLTTDHVIPQLNILTQFVGNPTHFEPQVLRNWETKNGDVFLLCTDGLTNHIGNRGLAKVLRMVSQGRVSPQSAADRLIEMANAAGGRDNITALIVRVKHIAH